MSEATKTVTTIKPVDALKMSMDAQREELKNALPAQVNVDKFIRVAKTAISNSPNIVNCERTSIFLAFQKCAQDGLLPDGREAAIVPFGNTATYMPMVAGLLKKIRNSGELLSLSPHVVYDKDEFAYWVDESGEHLTHRPLLSDDRGGFRAVYAIAKTKDGGVYIEVMSKGQVEKVRQASRGKDAGPWKQWYDEMARKTVIRRLAKRLPMSTDIEEHGLLQEDEFQAPPAPVSNESAPTAKSSRLSQVIETTATPSDAPTTVSDAQEVPI